MLEPLVFWSWPCIKCLWILWKLCSFFWPFPCLQLLSAAPWADGVATWVKNRSGVLIYLTKHGEMLKPLVYIVLRRWVIRFVGKLVGFQGSQTTFKALRPKNNNKTSINLG